MSEEKTKKQKNKNGKNVSVLPMYLGKILELLSENPTTHYVSTKLNMSSKDASSSISQLVSRGFVRRIDRGVFEILKHGENTERVGGVSHTESVPFIKELGKSPRKKTAKKVVKKSSVSCIKNPQPSKKKSKPKLAKDFYRLHGLQIELKINESVHGFIKSIVLSDKIFDNIRSGGNNGGHRFDYGIIKYLITSKKLFAQFPDTWEITGDTMSDVVSNLYEAIFQEVNKLGRRIRKTLIRSGRVSFDVTNMHIAISNCGVVKEFKNRRIRDITAYDSEDGKARFIMDFSHGLPELEAIHPQHVFDDAMEAKYFTNTLALGEYRKYHEKAKDFFENDEEVSLQEVVEAVKTNTKIILGIMDMVATQSKENVKTTKILKATAETVSQLASIMKIERSSKLKKNDDKETDEETIPYYVG